MAQLLIIINYIWIQPKTRNSYCHDLCYNDWIKTDGKWLNLGMYWSTIHSIDKLWKHKQYNPTWVPPPPNISITEQWPKWRYDRQCSKCLSKYNKKKSSIHGKECLSFSSDFLDPPKNVFGKHWKLQTLYIK